MKTLIWGAGREGRGFLADLFAPYSDIHLVDSDPLLISALRKAGGYRLLLRPAQGLPEERFFDAFTAWRTDDKELDGQIIDADAIALCVYLGDMPRAIARIAGGLEKRRQRNKSQLLDMFICANSINYAPELWKLLRAAMPDAAQQAWLDDTVGVVETLVRRTCISPGKEAGGDPLAIMTNMFPTLTIDGGAVKRNYGDLKILEPTADMRMEERRKIYTYNLLHATYAYLGYPKGYEFINQSRDDERIQSVAEKVYAESASALRARYNLGEKEMAEYENTMWSYVVNPAMRDPILRTGSDPIRKLSRHERIIGPALLCLEHGIAPDNIALAAAAAFRYDNPDDPAAQRLSAEIHRIGLGACMEKHCGVDPRSAFGIRIAALFNQLKN